MENLLYYAAYGDIFDNDVDDDDLRYNVVDL